MQSRLCVARSRVSSNLIKATEHHAVLIFILSIQFPLYRYYTALQISLIVYIILVPCDTYLRQKHVCHHARNGIIQRIDVR